MRLVRTLVSADAVEEVEAILDGYDIDHVVVREASDREDAVLVEFPVPTQAVETVLDELRDIGDGEDAYTVVASAESVFAPHVDELEARFVTGTEENDAIATEEVRATALDLTPSPLTYYSMTALSALVATAGLLLDSAAIVVGSMVIAPLVGSALTASVGTVLDERDMLWEGLKTQLLGLVLAIAAATAFGAALRYATVLPPALNVTTTQQIAGRVSPGLLSIVVGACAGAAGAFGLATGVSVALVGVMVAAALVPAAAAVGVGIAWGVPGVAVGAFLLLVLNVVAIHLSAAAVLWYLGYRPERSTAGGDDAVGATPRYTSAALLALVLAATLLVSGGLVAAQIGFERQANDAAGDVLADESYADLELVSVSTAFRLRAPVSVGDEQRVTVVVARPEDRPYPELSRAIANRIERETGREATVTVEFIERQTAASNGNGKGNRPFPTSG
ncbi:TIGR00341 family protein [Halobaculum magnesiiphilum]|uniref:TIGR00341 family protein n=1 Tax=Halobaculum magnesiiphilum TaxID=1017351 RepID=A0A8T8WJE5_9EURY|nr:TIGR00341 family protein [Halobaculum magnesiiphilum]QZP39783.1 TIGR00341 family protein [Halobaculum magnesiiphilum]